MPSNRQIIVGKVLESIPVGLVVLDPLGRVLAASPSAGAMLGQDLGSLRSRSWRHSPVNLTVDPAVNPEFNQVLRDLVDKQTPELHREITYQGPAGRRRLALTGSFLRVGDQVAGVVLILDDITELHQAREREYEVLRERNRLQRAMIASLNNLARSVAHHVRNPLAVIGGFARRLVRFLEERGLPSDQARIIFEQAVGLEGVVNAVSGLSNLPPVRPRRVRLGPVVERAMRFAQIPAMAAGRTVRFKVDLPETPVWIDPQLLGRVLEALFANSLEFARGPEVGISLKARCARGLVLRVADDGPGVSAEHRDFVFDPFFSTKTRGTGVGLAIARKIIMEHGGQIVLDPAEGSGAVFVIRLDGEPGVGDGGQGGGMDSKELAARAERLGLDVRAMSSVDAIRAVQRAEGFEACFARGLARSCGQEQCAFRRDCLSYRLIEDECDILFCGPRGRA